MLCKVTPSSGGGGVVPAGVTVNLCDSRFVY
jgi:hypothetical protein